MTEQEMQALVARCVFPSAGEAVHVAVSGGPDSSALLVLATTAECRVTAHHVDHGLRSGSAAEAHLVASLAERFGADFVAHTAAVEPGPNLEARARAARFAVLPEVIATGHTLDDRVETILLNLMRGAARSGLSAVAPSRRHPIAALRRSETHDLCRRLEINVVIDPSNLDPGHRRNRVRHEVLPLLDDIFERDVAPIIDRQASVMADEDELLDELAAAIDPTDAKGVAAAPVPLARRALRRWLIETAELEHPPSGGSIDRVLAVACGDAIAAQIEGGRMIYRSGQRMRIESPSLL